MNFEQRKSLRQKIEKQLGEIHFILQNAQNVVAASDSNQKLTPLQSLEIQQMALGIYQQRKIQSKRLRYALLLIEQEKYGQCVNCQKSISLKILEIQPDELLCSKCKM